MANGIRKSTLRRNIERFGATVDADAVLRAWRASIGRALNVTLFDRRYRTVTEPVWRDALQYSGVDEARYRSERRDCDDFAFWLKGQLAGKLALNGIGLVADYGWGHAYNALLVNEGPETRIVFCEPQTDAVIVPTDMHARALQNGQAIF